MYVCAAVGASQAALNRRLAALVNSGATALGPALAVAVGCASQRSHAEIIVCTDGLPNLGVGTTDELELKSTNGNADAQKFYTEIGTAARTNGTVINIIGMHYAHARAHTCTYIHTHTHTHAHTYTTRLFVNA